MRRNYGRLGLVLMHENTANGITFSLPEIDRKSTREKVESALEKYKMCLLMAPIEYEPNITSTIKDLPSGPNNQFHSSTEDAAVNRLEEERERNSYINWIERCINRLNKNEKDVIVQLYTKIEEQMNYMVYGELGFSETKYYKIKADAYYKLAFIMRMQVYKSDSEKVIS